METPTRDARAGNIVGSIRVDAVPRAATISGRQSLLLSPLKYSLYSSSRTFPSSLTYAPYPASLLASLLVIVGASLHTTPLNHPRTAKTMRRNATAYAPRARSRTIPRRVARG